MGEGEADSSHAEEGIVLARRSQIGSQLVPAEIHGADRHGAVAHLPDGLPVDTHLRLLVGQARLADEEELRSIEADTFRPGIPGFPRVLGRLDVGQEDHFAPIERRGRLPRDGRKRSETRLPIGAPLLEAAGVRRGRTHDDIARVAVDQKRVALPHVLRQAAESHDGRDPAAPGEDGHMRGRAAVVGHEGQDAIAVEGGRLARSDVARNDDDRVRRHPLRLGRIGSEVAQDPSLDVAQIDSAAAEVVGPGCLQ